MNFRFPTHHVCGTCKRDVEGWIEIGGPANNVVDSKGFMVFGDAVTCDECLTKQTGRHPDSPI